MRFLNKAGWVMLALALLPGVVPASDPAMAWVITSNERIAQCLSSIHVRQVDGQERQLLATGFELEPGMHTLQGTAKLDLTYCQVPREGHETGVPPLSALFEAGKVYYVGLDHSSKNRGDWRIVIWRVEDMEGQVRL
jgi:hypothetical protein